MKKSKKDILSHLKETPKARADRLAHAKDVKIKSKSWGGKKVTRDKKVTDEDVE